MESPINSGNYLLIFVRNPELGAVKTRLAKTIGDKKALEAYNILLEKTKEIALKVRAFRVVYYSNFVDFNDLFNPSYFYKDEQFGVGLGERMDEAVKSSMEEGAEKVIIIGSDCYDLKTEIIEGAFDALSANDVVIGPAEDGGYYLIGMKKRHKNLFENKEWGTSNVLLDSILTIKEQKLSYQLMPTLNDVDTIEDMPTELKEKLG